MGRNTWFSDKDKDDNVCVVIVLVTAYVEDKQGKNADKGEGRNVVLILHLAWKRRISGTLYC